MTVSDMVALGIVAIAAGWLLWRLWRAWQGGHSSCQHCPLRQRHSAKDEEDHRRD